MPERPFDKAVAPIGERLLGHKHVTDAYLLGLVLHQRGALATLDKRLPNLLPEDAPERSRIEVIS